MNILKVNYKLITQNMKKALLSFALITLLSCSNSNDNNTEQGNIANKWHLTSILENGTPITGYTCNTNFDITEFTEDGFSITKYADTNSNNVCTQYTENGNYTVASNILEDIQRNSNNVIIYKARYKITELTSTTLKLSLLYLYETNANGTNPYTSNYVEGEEVKVYSKM